ncbi:hypothetical protein ACLB2K_069230 [Fragaria x ananassa]
MEMAWQHGCVSLEVETDSLVAVKLVSSAMDHLHPFYSLVANCKEFLSRNWNVSNCKDFLSRNWNVSITHVYRGSNSVVDLLASIDHGYEPRWRFFSSPPPDVIPLLEADSSGSSKPRLVVF